MEEISMSSPLAVAVARKKKQKIKQNLRNTPNATTGNGPKITTTTGATPAAKDRTVLNKKRNRTLEVFYEGATLYALCLILSVLFSLFVHWCDGCSFYQGGCGAYYYDLFYYYYDVVTIFLCRRFHINCPPLLSKSERGDDIMESSSSSSHQSQSHHIASDTAAIPDVVFIAVLSWGFAILRVVLVQMLVPDNLAPKRLEALVRCKSVHLLSSSYDNDALTPKHSPNPYSNNNSRQQLNKYNLVDTVVTTTTTKARQQQPQPQEQHLNTTSTNNDMDADFPDDDYGNYDLTDYTVETEEKPFPPAMPLYQKDEEEEKETQLQYQHQPKPSNEFGFLQKWRSKGEKVARMVRVSSTRALGHEHLDEDIPVDATDTSRLFAAPRYATAVFRMYYMIGVCFVAMYWFRQANFWPIYLAGTGHTKNCWDLKGSFASQIDEDYDHANLALKYFFLVQGSYHLHSLCFHLVSMTMLAIYGGKSKGSAKTRTVSMKSGFKSYLGSLMQHIILVVFTAGSYFFSSLRRLGAIGMFAVDFSDIFLGLLQLCVNAPKDSLWSNPELIKWIHRGLVIPTFLYTRFFVLPFVVWYSATFESSRWLQQIERTLFPGVALAAYILFHGLMSLALVLNVIYFRRLLFHPHLQRLADGEQKYRNTR